jgi:hypothetical protein
LLDHHLLALPLNFRDTFCAACGDGRDFETLGAEITRAAEKNKPDGLLIGCADATKGPAGQSRSGAAGFLPPPTSAN